MNRHFYLVAGEPSGDRLGADLMAALLEIDPMATFEGIGGPAMADAGLDSQFPYEELAVMGIAELIPRIPGLLARIRQTADAVLSARHPDALVTIDSPDFCLRVARRVKSQSSIPVIHYVCPTIWAWRPGRARKLAKSVDHVLSLFPFEEAHLQDAGIASTFTGHRASVSSASAEDAARIAAEIGIGGGERLLVILPGSRMSEVGRLAPVFAEAAGLFLERSPGFRVAVAAAEPVSDMLAGCIDNWPVRPVLLDPRGMDPDAAERRKLALFRAADIALAASGTVSLELAAAGTPMVAAYDMHWATRQIIASSLKVDTVNLVNLVSGTRAVPEFLGKECRPAPIADALVRLAAEPAASSLQMTAFRSAMRKLGQGGKDPAMRAAEAVMALSDPGRPN